MKYHKIILAGGNGYLGTVLAGHFKNLADEIIVLSRKAAPPNGNITTIVWDGKTEGEWVNNLAAADLLVNLCGKNVNCRYTVKNKQEIFDSRLIPTALLNKVIAGMPNPPKLWINITSATIYRHAEDRPQDEVNGEMGDGFSVEVCKAWEQIFFDTVIPATRKVALRMGIVLGKQDGVFPRLQTMTQLGLGGKAGDGKQYVAWIYEKDAALITEWLIERPEIDGVLNCTAPEPVKNARLMQIIRKATRMPFGLPAPKWLLEIGALMIGTETELILKSRWVVPKRLLDLGYQFRFADIEEAVRLSIK